MASGEFGFRFWFLLGQKIRSLGYDSMLRKSKIFENMCGLWLFSLMARSLVVLKKNSRTLKAGGHLGDLGDGHGSKTEYSPREMK